jgi:hypothetical protein
MSELPQTRVIATRRTASAETLAHAVSRVRAGLSLPSLRDVLESFDFHPDLVAAVLAWAECDATALQHPMSRRAVAVFHLAETGHLPADAPAWAARCVLHRLADETLHASFTPAWARIQALSAVLEMHAVTSDFLLGIVCGGVRGFGFSDVRALASHPSATRVVWNALLATTTHLDIVRLLTYVDRATNEPDFATVLLDHAMATEPRVEHVIALLPKVPVTERLAALTALISRASDTLPAIVQRLGPAILGGLPDAILTPLFHHADANVRVAAILGVGTVSPPPRPAAVPHR